MENDYESDLPKKWIQEISGKEHGEAATVLSTHRTFMSTARSHMANERTHLAYLRTSLSLMSFGITLNRFSVFLRENKSVESGHRVLLETAYVGIGIVIVGVIILAWALRRYRQVSRQIETDSFTSSESAMSYLTIAVLILGGLSSIWMLLGRD